MKLANHNQHHQVERICKSIVHFVKKADVELCVHEIDTESQKFEISDIFIQISIAEKILKFQAS